MMRRLLVTLLLLPSLAMLMRPPAGDAAELWGRDFRAIWERSDRPVAETRVSRTWIWGPQPLTAGLVEPYHDSPNGQRVVQYFDKSRMEITQPDGDRQSAWYVTNGLLARELITGRLQTGDDAFEQRAPSDAPVAGDRDGGAPSYAAFGPLLEYAPIPLGWTVIQTVDSNGWVAADPDLARFGVTTARLVPETNHTVASVFTDFLLSQGTVYDAGRYYDAPLFPEPVYATGLPISEPYWTWAAIAGQAQWILVQAFERRVLTYAPGNPKGWQVESGNVGRHYLAWRYAEGEPVLAPEPPSGPVIVLDPGHDRSTGGALGVEYRHTLETALRTQAWLEEAGYVVRLVRPDYDTVLYGDPNLMPANASRMDANYNEGYVHTSRALQFVPDLLISLHYNGAASSAAAGLTVYYCDFGGEQNRWLAEIAVEELTAALATAGYTPPYAEATEDGAIGKSYGHLATLGNVYDAPFDFRGNRLAGVPAILTEPLFETNPTERRLIEDPDVQEALARAYLRAVDRYFGR